MTPPHDRDALRRLRAFVAEALGLDVAEHHLQELSDAAMARAGAAGLPSLDAYVDRLLGPTSPREEIAALAAALTVGETYFLRHLPQLDAFAAVAAEHIAAGRPLRVLSAGCASGEEAYSLGILLADRIGGVVDFSIVGVDVNRGAIERARAGRYGRWSLRDTPADVRRRHFIGDGNTFTVNEAARRRVHFHVRNLVEDDPGFFRPGAFDVIFCRNVLMYFSATAFRSVVARLASALTPGGFLFLGHAETLRGVSDAFEVRQARDAFYYQLDPASDHQATSPSRAAPPQIAAPDGGWVSTIDRSSARIEDLARRPVVAAAAGSGVTLEDALRLVDEERFGDALAALDAGAPVDDARGLGALVRALMLANVGEPGEAERACRELFSRADLESAAHHVVALCRDRAGDVAGAIEHDRAATRADPTFAMAHLHLGVLLKRRGAVREARLAIEAARTHLQGERAENLRLFAGGFTRAALVNLCTAELSSLDSPR